MIAMLWHLFLEDKYLEVKFYVTDMIILDLINMSKLFLD